jgi:hypothetical protein
MFWLVKSYDFTSQRDFNNLEVDALSSQKIIEGISS